MKSACESCLSAFCHCDEVPSQSSNSNGDNSNCDKKPLEKWYNKFGTPDKRLNGRCWNGTVLSPLSSIQENESSETSLFVSTIRSQTVSNPFDAEVDSLHLSAFSPSVFAITSKKSEDSVFRWSIEQLAVLKPAEIDETSQQDLWIDSEKEVKAQKAIDAFFSKNNIVPSPWAPTMKYISFTPNMASTACKSSTSEISFMDDGPGNHVSTQTALSIPPNFDFMTLLGRFFTNPECIPGSMNNSSIDGDSIGNSSLRRKLFINEEKLTSPALIKEQASKMSKYATPDSVPRRQCRTPGSDAFASSPIALRRRSISASGTDTSPGLMCSPDVSPISFARIPSSGDSDKSKNSIHDSPVSAKYPQSVMSCHNGDSSQSMSSTCLEFEVGTSYHEIKKCNEEQTSTQLYSDTSSTQRDTGYLTGSLSLSSGPSLICQQTGTDFNLRATPVAELLGDCAITKAKMQLFQEDCSMMSCDTDMSIMM